MFFCKEKNNSKGDNCDHKDPTNGTIIDNQKQAGYQSANCEFHSDHSCCAFGPCLHVNHSPTDAITFSHLNGIISGSLEHSNLAMQRPAGR